MRKVLGIAILMFFISMGLIVSDGIFDDKIGEDSIYGVIYGNKVELNGEPSERLKSRLDISIKLYKDNQIQKLIVSGGTGIEGFDEAIVMKQYLLNAGIPKSDIITDSDGYTTHKTSENTFEIISDLEDDLENISVVGVSQYFHISRVKLSLKSNGFRNVYGIAPKYFELRDIYSIFREVPAYLKYKFLYNTYGELN